jgi:hypothetical protein
MPTHAETQFYIHRERQERALADRTPNSDGRTVAKRPTQTAESVLPVLTMSFQYSVLATRSGKA